MLRRHLAPISLHVRLHLLQDGFSRRCHGRRRPVCFCRSGGGPPPDSRPARRCTYPVARQLLGREPERRAGTCAQTCCSHCGTERAIADGNDRRSRARGGEATQRPMASGCHRREGTHRRVGAEDRPRSGNKRSAPLKEERERHAMRYTRQSNVRGSAPPTSVQIWVHLRPDERGPRAARALLQRWRLRAIAPKAAPPRRHPASHTGNETRQSVWLGSIPHAPRATHGLPRRKANAAACCSVAGHVRAAMPLLQQSSASIAAFPVALRWMKAERQSHVAEARATRWPAAPSCSALWRGRWFRGHATPKCMERNGHAQQDVGHAATSNSRHPMHALPTSAAGLLYASSTTAERCEAA